MAQRFALPYRPQANGIVERTNQEVLNHLRAIVFDLRVLTHWKEYLPMVERIINSSCHSSLGTAPFRFLYGDAVTLDRGLLTARTEHDVADFDAIPTSKYVAKLTAQLEAICVASRLHQAVEFERRRPKGIQGEVVHLRWANLFWPVIPTVLPLNYRRNSVVPCWSWR